MAKAAASSEARTWTVLELLREATDFLAKKEVSRSPRLDAELLLADTLSTDRVGLYTRFDQPVSNEERSNFRELIRRRLGGEPVAYIRGRREFWGIDFSVTPAVLIPRPETEVLVEEALKTVRSAEFEAGSTTDKPLSILDLCTGSGCIAVALATELPGARVYAADLSEEALAMARQNAARHAVDHRMTFLGGDLWEALKGQDIEGACDMIVSNPPYIPCGEIPSLEKNVRDFEPITALDGGTDGLDVIRRIVEGAPAFMKPGGVLVIETGWNQGDEVKALMETNGFGRVRIVKDYAGLDRVVSGILHKTQGQ